jgi:hypothetical protein
MAALGTDDVITVPAALLAVGLAALAAFCLPAWSAIGAAIALVAVLVAGGAVPYALLAAGVAAAAGWAWRRHEARAARRWLPCVPQASTVARPKTRAREGKPESRRRAA